MFRAWSFALVLALGCTSGWSTADAANKALVAKGLQKSVEWFESKYGKCYLHEPIRCDPMNLFLGKQMLQTDERPTYRFRDPLF
jgi:hypothetical protein